MQNMLKIYFIENLKVYFVIPWRGIVICSHVMSVNKASMCEKQPQLSQSPYPIFVNAVAGEIVH